MNCMRRDPRHPVMLRAFGWGLFVFLTCELGAGAETLALKGAFDVHIENDSLGSSLVGYYTNGLRFVWLGPSERFRPWFGHHGIGESCDCSRGLPTYTPVALSKCR